MQLELDVRKFIRADVEDTQEYRTEREQILSEPWRLSLAPVLDDSYDLPEVVSALIENLRQFGRPGLCTEYMARPLGSTFEGVLPIFKQQDVGAYNWGLVLGKTQTHSWLSSARRRTRGCGHSHWGRHRAMTPAMLLLLMARAMPLSAAGPTAAF